MPGSGINLLSINEAFGEKADLYVDVLGIQPNATTDQIQQAYFNRRDELFHSLSRMDQRGVDDDSQKRFQLERQMDGVVMALRVLWFPKAWANIPIWKSRKLREASLFETTTSVP